MSTLKTGRPSRKEKAIASVQEEQETTVRMNVNLPKTFYKKLKQKALNEDTTVTEIVKKALQSYIS